MNHQKFQFIEYKIYGIDCANCVNKIETYCTNINGIIEAKINYSSSTLHIKLIPKKNIKDNLEKSIKNLGYTIKEINSKNINNSLFLEKNTIKIKKKFREKYSRLEINKKLKTSPLNNNEDSKKYYKKIAFLVLLYIISLFINYFSLKYGNIAFCIVAIIGIIPILKKALLFIKMRLIFSIELLICIATFGAILTGSSEEASAVIILFLIGESLEIFTSQKARKEINSLLSFLPDFSSIKNPDGTFKIIPSSEIQKGDLIETKPGERFAVDGIIDNGKGYIDESLLTGESQPIYKTNGEKVFAGSINYDGYFIIMASSSGNDNTVTRIIKMIEDAQNSKPQIIRNIEKFSQIYTPIILIIAILVTIIPPLFLNYSWQEWIYRGLTLLLIGCPCALVISTPTAIYAAITVASKMGILIKNASSIEIIKNVKHIAFDKTGTITTGKLKLCDIISFNSNDTNILKIAATVEFHSKHPIAIAINEYITNSKIYLFDNVINTKYIAGHGISATIDNKNALICSPKYASKLNYLNEFQMNLINDIQKQGKTLIVIIYNYIVIGFISFIDQLKQDSITSINKLNNLGINTIILTGDNKYVSELIAKTMKIQVKAEMSPEQKLNYIENISRKEKIIMVGDGINDAPALAAADVGIAMQSGADIATDTSQVVISKNNVSSIVDIVMLSKKTMNNIKQNIIFTISLKFIFLILTILGETQLWMAILTDSGATLIVTLNALRILKEKTFKEKNK